MTDNTFIAVGIFAAIWLGIVACILLGSLETK